MTRIVYVNCEFLKESEAKISVFDRGFLFADGIYEVSAVLEGKLIDNEAHLRRLARSLDELNMASPVTVADIPVIQQGLIDRNGLREGTVYTQITRGVALREFAYPKSAAPSIVMFTQARELINSRAGKAGISVVTVPDLRWARRDIKTIGLLAASMAKQAALDRGADDAWLTQDGFVTEGSATNAYIVNSTGDIITHHLGKEILAGITRAAILSLAKEHGIRTIERPFSVIEACAAAEAFVTGASTFVYPVVRINDQAIGTGEPGPIACQLRRLYIETALKSLS